MQKFKNLFQQVVDEINKRTGRQPIKQGLLVERGVDIQSLPKALELMITQFIESFNAFADQKIISGFYIRATNPKSNQFIVYDEFNEGHSGIASGVLIKLDVNESRNVTLQLPSKTGVKYITVSPNGNINLEDIKNVSNLVIGKIVIPKDTAVKITDDESQVDAYLISARDALFDNQFTVDDDTKLQLKNYMKQLLASNLVGTIKLSENLTIQNTRGTLVMDSASIKIFHPSTGSMLAWFNPNGVYFFDENGQPLSHFGKTEARVGNIKVLTDRIKSENFQTGVRGFEIKADGDAEFMNVKALSVDSPNVMTYKDAQNIQRDIVKHGQAADYVVALDGTGDFNCDGISDNLEIKQAIDLLPNGGKILIKSGTYSIQDSILLTNSDIIFEGFGKKTILKYPDGIYSGASKYMFYLDNVKDIEFNSITFDANKNGVSGNWGNCIQAVRVDGLKIQHCVVRNLNYFWIGITTYLQHAYISDNTIEDANTRVIQGNVQDTVIERNRFMECYQSLQLSQYGKGQNVISKNYILPTKGLTTSTQIYVDNEFIIEGNCIRNTRDYAIVSNNSCILDNNIISDCERGIYGWLTSVVSDNHIEDCDEYGIILGSKCTVEGNNLVNNGGLTFSGICVAGAGYYNTVSGNFITGSKWGIEIAGWNNVIIGNMLLNNAVDGLTNYGSNNIVEHNKTV